MHTLLDVQGHQFGSFGVFPVFDDLVSNVDLNFHGICAAKFISFRYSFIYQMTKQNVKAPGALC